MDPNRKNCFPLLFDFERGGRLFLKFYASSTLQRYGNNDSLVSMMNALVMKKNRVEIADLPNQEPL